MVWNVGTLEKLICLVWNVPWNYNIWFEMYPGTNTFGLECTLELMYLVWNVPWNYYIWFGMYPGTNIFGLECTLELIYLVWNAPGKTYLVWNAPWMSWVCQPTGGTGEVKQKGICPRQQNPRRELIRTWRCRLLFPSLHYCHQG